jgi:hypothetical protein
MVDWKRPKHILQPPDRPQLPDRPRTGDWIIKDIRVVHVVGDFNAAREAPALTPYHSPHTARTIMGGPGNRSKIMSCSCGARFNGDSAYVGRDRRLCDWYADHAGIAGGGEAVTEILRQYDVALDVRDYPDHPRMQGKPGGDPEEIFLQLRVDPTGNP